MKRWVLEHFGCVRPFRFERMLVLVTAIVLAVVVLGVAAALIARTGFEMGAPRGLSWGTPRSWYFVYLIGLIVAALVLARWTVGATVLLSLAAVEIGLGFGSALLYRIGLTPSPTLFPNNYERPIYGWHPLLQVRPEPTPEDERKKFSVFINSQHQRGREWTKAELEKKRVVALFGGSTTLDFSVPDGESWGDRLEQALGPNRYAVVNHGVAGYTTAEHLIQTAFYPDTFGVMPHCAVYYVGWNDLSLSHDELLDGGFTNHMSNQIDAFMGRRLDVPSLSISPLLKLLSRFVQVAFDTVRSAPLSGRRSSQPDPRLEALFLRNVDSISAINRQRGIKTLWVGQVMNVDHLAAALEEWSPFIPDEATWPLIRRLNGQLKREAGLLGDVYVDIPVGEFKPSDFIDEGHFSPAGSAKFASLLAPSVAAACDK
ncbi:SGNH/GDSL hydrolase family protein [Reyranella sp.]|uniref:SGNH/GDSL hydrolase family protein n=1 Tax=Reyranella sp. TaxID=1929291 RepID=UPI003BAAC448